MKTDEQEYPTLKRRRHIQGWVWRRLREGWGRVPLRNTSPSGLACRPLVGFLPGVFVGPLVLFGPPFLLPLVFWVRSGGCSALFSPPPGFGSGSGSLGGPLLPSRLGFQAGIRPCFLLVLPGPLGFSLPPRRGAQLCPVGLGSCVAFLSRVLGFLISLGPLRVV